MNLSAVPFTVMSCLVIGYVFRAIPIFPNKWIPLVVILSGETFLFLNPHPSSVSNSAFYAHSIIGGLFIGLLAWLFHDKFIQGFEDKICMKFPSASIILTSTAKDGTKTWTNPNPPNNPPPATGGFTGLDFTFVLCLLLIAGVIVRVVIQHHK